MHAADAREPRSRRWRGALEGTEIAGVTTNRDLARAHRGAPRFRRRRGRYRTHRPPPRGLVARKPATVARARHRRLARLWCPRLRRQPRPVVDSAGRRPFSPAHPAGALQHGEPRSRSSVRAPARDGLFDVELAPVRRRFTLPAPAAAGRGEGLPGSPAGPAISLCSPMAGPHDFTVADPLARAASRGRARRCAAGRRCRASSSWSASRRARSVGKGQPLLVLEAMKMEHTILGPGRRGDRGDCHSGRAGERRHRSGPLRRLSPAGNARHRGARTGR